MIRKALLVKGIVQGVGFRPFVYRVARDCNLSGFVRNTSKGVEIEVQGPVISVEEFIVRLQKELPPLALIEQIEVADQPINVNANHSFEITTSYTDIKGDVRIPADIKICEDCKQDILDSSSRFAFYPLTNCTNCGPRFTVIRDVPYDRAMTTMEPFAMCKDCQGEYNDPMDRRFHAQPTACPACGPALRLMDSSGNILHEGSDSLRLRVMFKQAAELIRSGNIIAIKGIGGFHLACDANLEHAVQKLRARKNRPRKPFALIARNIDNIVERCRVTAIEQELLTSPQAPIVILNKKEIADFEATAPDLTTIGVMLPYTPLHVLLFEIGNLDWLLMTSANPKNQPITKDNQEALEQLSGIADFFLIHDRDIEQRTDDSLVRVIENRPVFYRRSRGYAPEEIKVPLAIPEQEVILAVGGEMKNSFAYMKGNHIRMSQYIGEIDSWEGRQSFLHSMGHFERLFNYEPTIVAYDQHPTYQVSEIAKLLQYREKVEIQHHHAHMASCMAEHGITDQVLGVILDGTGYGDDETLWGTEFLYGDYASYERLAYGIPLPVVGGEKAIKEPWRMAIGAIHAIHPTSGFDEALAIWPEREKEIRVLWQMLEKGIQVVKSSGAGRLFDTVAALLKGCEISSYEGEAAIWLSNVAETYRCKGELSLYPVVTVKDVDGKQSIDWRPMLGQILAEIRSDCNPARIAYKFHRTLGDAIVNQAMTIFDKKQPLSKRVVLSGGTWHNELLLLQVVDGLRNQGVSVYYHEKVPTNDGGIALGQALIAAARYSMKDKRGIISCV
ncbi:carbamoyltransferase HypF [Desulfuribacillus stibiiarsenatis]|uniref:Carbamoyltransferase n=1 Tax=Desulfuribacillus stibiiarsenatis TaxID=1390249 RepID=A0A1E5L2N7_9FIRM|nr:carbamoyltransferase HypF [Desulfuribacillus stibiiarsenatis]